MATATEGQALIAGAQNSEGTETMIYNTTSFPTAGSCFSTTADTGGILSCGTNGLTGSGTTYGVRGTVGNAGNAGMLGDGPTGVWGIGQGSASTGVLGQGSAYGVHGNSTGWGAWGEGDDRGVYGISNNEGVVGFGNNVGVRADSPNIALRVTGKVELSRSGVATIAGTSTTPKSSVVVSSVALSAKSMVLVMIQKNIAGVWVRAAVPNVAGSSVTIYLNKAVSKSVPVAWMVIERP
jgi:hypothetical protein